MNTTEGYIYKSGQAPQTRTAISSKNKLFAAAAGQKNMTQIGVTASFEPSDSRAVEAVRGIGYGDQIAELVPNASEPITISITRSALYLSLLMQNFGYNAGVDGLVRALKHHRWPFDIKAELVFSEISTANQSGGPITVASELSPKGSLNCLITYYEACWMTSYSWSFTSDTSLVQENCDVSCTDITDGNSTYYNSPTVALDTGNSPYGNFGSSTQFGGGTFGGTGGG